MIEALKKVLAALGVAVNGDDGASRETEMISCEQALERLFEYLDGEVEGETRHELERHFEVCRRCYPRLKFEKSFMEALRRVRSGREAPPELRARIVHALEKDVPETG